MSTEVECSQVDLGLTAASSSGGAEEKNQNKSEGQKGSEKQLQDGHSSEATKSPTDMHKKCKENDKENDQSSTVDSAVETVKRKVVEAPPPKVNPWTKRTVGRVPINNINSQEKGGMILKFPHMIACVCMVTKLYNMVTAQQTAPRSPAEHVVAAF